MRLRRRLIFRAFCGIALALVAAGCSAPTEAERDNRRLVDALLTAITMKNAEWLDEASQLTDERHRDGHLTDDEFDELNAVIETAKSGKWSDAEKQGYEFRQKHPFVAEGK